MAQQPNICTMNRNFLVSLCYLTLMSSLVGCSASSTGTAAKPSAIPTLADSPSPAPTAPPKWSVPQSQDSLSFSPDGKVLLTACGKGVTAWRVSSGKQIKTLVDSEYNFPVGAWSPDGSKVLTAGSSGYHVWDWESGENEKVGLASMYAVMRAAFLPNDRFILQSNDGGVETQKRDGSERMNYEGHTTAFCNELFATCDPHGKGKTDVVLRDTDKLETKNVISWPSPPGTGICVGLALSDGGKWLAAATADQIVLVFDTSKKSPEKKLNINEPDLMALAISPDGKFIVTGGKGRLIEMWEVSSGLSVFQAATKGQVNAITFAPDGKHAAAVANDETVYLWPVAGSSK